MIYLRAFIRNTRAATAAEFALVLPLMLLFLFGIIDVGRYGWAFNRSEKATQAGARMAVVTNVVATGLTAKNYVGAVVGGTTLQQGDVIPAAALGTISCNATSQKCCEGSDCSWGYSDTAFQSVVSRMQDIDPAISANNVIIEYSGSGLGYAGDPSGMEIAPLTTVRLTGMQFSPTTLYLFDATVPLPSFSYTLTMEDGSGTVSN